MLNHLDEKGNPKMVDVSEKQVSRRKAVARSIVELPAQVLTLLVEGDLQTKKVRYFKRLLSQASWPLKKRAS